jgi:PIN domain nuclease of toxin-antitoxin system
MNILLDTHALLWFIEGDQRLPSADQMVLVHPDTKNYVSRISHSS